MAQPGDEHGDGEGDWRGWFQAGTEGEELVVIVMVM